jgi:hypothetical protein
MNNKSSPISSNCKFFDKEAQKNIQNPGKLKGKRENQNLHLAMNHKNQSPTHKPYLPLLNFKRLPSPEKHQKGFHC